MWKEILGWCMPRGRWLLAAFAFVVAGGVAAPLVAQAASVTVWNLGAQVTDLRIGPSGEVWTMTGDAPRRLVPGTNEVTTYSHPLAGTGVLAVDGAGKVWSPDSFSTAPGTVYVISRLDPTTLDVSSWPVDTPGVASSIAVDGSGNVWFASNTTAVWRLVPSTNTITKWTLPISVDIGIRQPFGVGGRVWLSYSSGVAVLNPATSQLTYWAAPSGAWQSPFAHTDGTAWFAVQYSGTAVDSIARLNPGTNQVTEWTCRAGCDGLDYVHVRPDGKVWFTETGTAYNTPSYIGRLDPAATPPAFSEWPLRCPDITAASCGSAVWVLPLAVEFSSAGDVWTYFGYTGYHPDYRVARLTP